MLCTLLLALAQAAPEAQLEGCRRCDHRGVQDCRRHGSEERELAPWIRYCSAWTDCGDCGGTLLVDCSRCAGGPESESLADRRAAAAAWQARLSPAEEHLGKRLLRVSTARFELEGDFPTLRSRAGKVLPDEFLLLLARDLEQTAEQIQVDFALEDEEMPAGIRFWFFGAGADHRAVLARFLKNPQAGGDYMMLGARPAYSVQTSDSTFLDDAGRLRAQALHNGVHMLLSSAVDDAWIGEQRSGWFDAGAAHEYERMALGVSTTFCIHGRTEPPDYHQGDWELPIRKALAREREPLVPDLLPKPMTGMEEEEHAFSWSLYHFLRETRPEALGALFRGLKAGRPESELFQELLGRDLLQLELEWRDYVDSHYGRKRKRRGR